MGCDSYWISTACVPSDQIRRKEAIGKISSVFENNKLTLIYNRDIVSLEAPGTKDTDISLMEKLLAAFLICDWNLGDWALFEASKGAKNLHLLCKNDVPVYLHDVVLFVHTKGSIDLSNLILASYYLLRPHKIWALSSVQAFFWDDSAAGFFSNRDTRTMAIEEAGQLLSRCCTNCEADQILIWCLLLGIPPTNVASEFWGTIQEVRTGYILSSVPRISGTPYFSWAPRSPNALSSETPAVLSQSQRSFWRSKWTAIGQNYPRGDFPPGV
jgi:hypothetical protein